MNVTQNNIIIIIKYRNKILILKWMIFYRVHGFKCKFTSKRYITDKITINVASHKNRHFPVVSLESKRTITLDTFNGTMRFRGE